MHSQTIFGSCFYLVLDVTKDDAELLYDLQNAKRVQQATQALIDGTTSADDFLDLVENHVGGIDNYLDEITLNVEALLYSGY